MLHHLSIHRARPHNTPGKNHHRTFRAYFSHSAPNDLRSAASSFLARRTPTAIHHAYHTAKKPTRTTSEPLPLPNTPHSATQPPAKGSPARAPSA
ncbi:hypothetical protein A0H81_13812 [Grifola frondosa]|uniref:Uncharacterized protein n=1 Tax=Grifola frondosa TaxID=5627 RepID=A0A1C7LQR0_GRIFR|nr:hypothetical protein A0H81_13812 [Grifola frondosa]